MSNLIQNQPIVRTISAISDAPVECRTRQQPSRLVIVGHVDHGKSTLIGRILHDTHALEAGKIEKVKRICEEQHKPFEWAFLLDALEEEQLQGITIDTTRVEFKTEKRDFLIIDAPGHKEFLKNMISGAANAHAAVLLIDAAEGVREQSKRHGQLVRLLGIEHIIVLINKMDLVDYRQDVFESIRVEYLDFLKTLGVHPAHVLPVSARNGDNIIQLSENTPWYNQPGNAPLINLLERIEPVREYDPDAPLRFPIQDVYKFDDRRILAGRIESGALRVGDSIKVFPSEHTARIRSIEVWPETHNLIREVSAGHTVGITLDEALFTDRGQVIVHADDEVQASHFLQANIFWMQENPLVFGKHYKLKIGTQESPVTLYRIEQVVNAASIKDFQDKDQVGRHEVARVVLRLERPMVTDAFHQLAKTGRFVIMDGYTISGGGIILADQQKYRGISASPVTLAERRQINGYAGGIIQVRGSGPPASDKLSRSLERMLFNMGLKVYALNSSAPADIQSHMVAALLDAGLIVIIGLDIDLPAETITYPITLSGSAPTGERLAHFLKSQLPGIQARFKVYNHDQVCI